MIKKFNLFETDWWNDENIFSGEISSEDNWEDAGLKIYAIRDFEGRRPGDFYGKITDVDNLGNFTIERGIYLWQRYRGYIQQYIDLGILKIEK